MKTLRVILSTSACLTLAAVLLTAQDPAAAPPAAKQRAKRPPRPGVATPGVKREMASIKPIAVFPVEGTPDWQVVTSDAIWVSNGPRNTVHKLDPKTNTVVAAVEVGKKPCSGLAEGFGSIWVPNCTDQTVSRVDLATNKVIATIPVGPANSEGGIAASPDAVWMPTDLAAGKLARIDPTTNTVVATISVAPGSVAATYLDGAIWVSSPMGSVVTKIDAKTNEVLATIPTGPTPRFITSGGGSVWTLNQGDGTVSRIDGKTNKLIANIETGAPGTGGEISFGEGYLWFTVFEIPITQIDPATNAVVKQWFGEGGDAIRIGHGSIWVSNLRQQNLWRIDPKQP
jgi:YVTN family beta-propeller protein